MASSAAWGLAQAAEGKANTASPPVQRSPASAAARSTLSCAVHVHAGRGAGAQHFRIAHKAAQVDHFGRKGLLHGKDALVEPVHEGHIVGQAAQQGHGRVGVGVDQARQKDCPAQVKISPGLPVRGQICARAHGGHLSVVHGQRGAFQHPALTVPGDDNRRVEQHVALLHEFSLK